MQCYLESLPRAAINGKCLAETSASDYCLQYVHVADVAAACLLAASVEDGRLAQRVTDNVLRAINRSLTCDVNDAVVDCYMTKALSVLFVARNHHFSLLNK